MTGSAKQSVFSLSKGRMDCFRLRPSSYGGQVVAFALRNDVESFSIQFSNSRQMRVRIPAARFARVVRQHFAHERAQGMPGAG
jgi:hypothetical protein